MKISPVAMRSPGATFRNAWRRSFAKLDSKTCARSTSFSTRLACESLNVRFTNDMSKDEQVIFTSSRM